MIKNKKQKKIQDQNQIPLKLREMQMGSDFEQEMKCDQTFEEINFMSKKSQQLDEKFTCACSKCFGYMKKFENVDLDAEEKKRQKRREYKKRQKLKMQQKKEQASRDLAQIIADIYTLKTSIQAQKQRIKECLNLIQKNQTRFYQFINTIIRQQVEAIRKQMRTCLSQLTSIPTPNLSRIPQLFQQFERIHDASPQVQTIINNFIAILSEKTKEHMSPHHDLDKKTFIYVLKSDPHNRINFGKLIRMLVNNQIKQQRQKQMVGMMINMIRQKNFLKSFEVIVNGEQDVNVCQEGDSQVEQQNEQIGDEEEEAYIEGQDGEMYSQEDTSQYDGEDYYTQAEKTTKSSQKQQEEGFQDDGDQNSQNSQQNRRRNQMKRRRKNKNIKAYQASFEKTYEALQLLQTTLNFRKDDKLPCNLDEQWLGRFKEKFLKPKIKSQKVA